MTIKFHVLCRMVKVIASISYSTNGNSNHRLFIRIYSIAYARFSDNRKDCLNGEDEMNCGEYGNIVIFVK